MQHPGEPSSACVLGVGLGKPVGQARDAHVMRVALRLREVRAHPAPELDERADLRISPHAGPEFPLENGKAVAIELAAQVARPHDDRIFAVVAVVRAAR